MAARLESRTIEELKKVVGEKSVLSQQADLLTYSFDSALDRALPSLVVLPGTLAELIQVTRIITQAKVAFVARGAATSLCGGPIPLNNAVIIGMARLNQIGKLDKNELTIQVEPGVVNLRLQKTVDPDGLFYAPDPGSQKACTIGGNVATNAGGPHCLKYGVTSNSVVGLEVILPTGQIVKLNTSDDGYDIVGLLVGSEGTLGVISRIWLQLIPKPRHVRTMLVSFHSIEDAIQAVTNIIAAGILPATLEAMDKTTVEAIEAFMQAGYPLDAEGVLLIEVDGNSLEELDGQVSKIETVCQQTKSFEFRFAKTESERQRIWDGRRGSYAAMARLAPNVLVEDGAVPRTQLPEALKRIKKIAEDRGLRVSLLFHAGDGNLHPQIIFDERIPEETKVVKEAGYLMLKACVDLGGTISGEHGIGIDKREAMKWLFSRETLSLFRRIKNEFDPLNICNPDKLIPLVSSVKAKNDTPVDVPEEVPDNATVNSLGLLTPENEEAVVTAVKDLVHRRKGFGVRGLGTRFPLEDNITLNVSRLNTILDFDRGNLTVTVQGGAPLSQVREELAKENQYLWVAGEGSIGGVVATRSSHAPPLRDQILGMRVLLPTGEIVKFGAKTMKNVAGYDAAKLLIGSWGTLGIILDVTFRLFPYPAKEMKTKDTVPFVLNELHLKIKKAFDPLDLLSKKTTMYTASDIRFFKERRSKPPPPAPTTPQTPHVRPQPPEEPKPERYGDGFWFGGQ